MIARNILFTNLKISRRFIRGIRFQSPFQSTNVKYISCSCTKINTNQDALSTMPIQYKSNFNFQTLNKILFTKNSFNYVQNELTRAYSTLSHPNSALLICSKDFATIPLKSSKRLNTTRQSEAHFQIPKVAEKKQKLWESKGIISDLEETGAKMKGKFGEIIERENIWTIPNFLCVGRIVMSPFLCYSVISSSYSLAFGMFAVAGFTDLIDGMIARKFPSQASRLGSFLDPLADKILISSLFLTLTYVGLIPFVLTGIIVYRDAVIIAGASYVRFKSLPPPFTFSRYFDATHATAQLTPTFMSKLNTAVQFGLIVGSLGAPIFAYTDHYLLHTLWFVTGLTTLASGIGYIFSKESYKILSKRDL